MVKCTRQEVLTHFVSELEKRTVEITHLDMAEKQPVNKDDLSMIEAKFENGGIKAVQDFAKEQLEKVRQTEVKLAVTGAAGVGKSTFINAIRDMYDDDEGAAEVGVVETTAEIKEYAFKDNPNVVLYDLPGVGTKNFPKHKYLEFINPDQFDIVLLLSSTRFTENDGWLATEIKRRKIPFFFVRTKVFADIDSQKNKRNPKAPEDVIDEIRKSCKENLKGQALDIYLIDSLQKGHELLDFITLKADITEKLSMHKKQAFMDTFRDLATLNPKLIKKKGEFLRQSIFYTSLKSGTVGLVPIPGVSFVVDVALVTKGKRYFATQLGLTNTKLGNLLSGSVSASKLDIAKGILETVGKEVSAELIKELAISETAETIASFVPVIGSFISSVTSFVGTRYVLNKILDQMIDDALKINQLICEELGTEV